MSMKNIDLDLRLVELFCCVYEKGSIAESSNCLHLSQSTISFHLRQLEKSIGLKLFYKKGRKLYPTSNAHMLYPYAKKLLELKLSMLEEIRLMTGTYKGYIKIGASSIPGTYLLPEFVSQYLERNPNTHIELLVEDSGLVLKRVQSGDVDLGFVGFNYSETDLEVVEVWDDRVVFVGGKGIKENLTLEELVKLPFILREPASGTRRFMEEYLKSYRISPRSLNIIMTVNKNEVLLDVLRRVRAVSFVSSRLLEREGQKGIKPLKIKDFDPPIRKFYLIYSRERPQSPAVRNFLQEVYKNLQKVSL